MFHGQRWLRDTRFFSPMADTSVGNIFLYDHVIFNFGPHPTYSTILGVSGLLARIQCVERDGDDVYVMGDDVSVPTENITALTRLPLYIRDKNSLSLLVTYSLISGN